MKTLPLRLTILHLAQRFRIDGDTFMKNSLRPTIHSQVFDYTQTSLIRLDYTKLHTGSRDSQD